MVGDAGSDGCGASTVGVLAVLRKPPAGGTVPPIASGAGAVCVPNILVTEP